MSQTIPDAAPGAPQNEQIEPNQTNTPHAAKSTQPGMARRRPDRRPRPAATPAAEQPVAPAAIPAAAAAPVATTPTEPRKPAARGAGAKRPAPRKGTAQLVINRAQEAAEATLPEVPEAVAPVEAPALTSVVPVTDVAAESGEATTPTVVPVLSPATPLAGRKTRFGLPRRLQAMFGAPAEAELQTQPVEAPAASVELPPLEAPTIEEPGVSAEPEASAEPGMVEETQPAEAEEPTAPTEEQRRYRFDRLRRTASAPLTRPERLRAPTALAAAPFASALPTPAAASSLELPSIEELTERVRAVEPPTPIATPSASAPVATPAPVELTAASAPVAPAASAEAESLEGGDEAETGEEEANSPASRRRRRRRRGSTLRNGAHPEEGDLDLAETVGAPIGQAPTGALDEIEPESAYADVPSAYAQEQSYPYEPEPRRAPARQRTDRYGYGTRAMPTPTPAPVEPGWDEPQPQEQQRPAAYQEQSAFSGPEPAFARGFGPQPRGVATTVRETYPRTPSRVERGAAEGATPASMAQLGSIIRESINAQTDRLLNELRHQQQPPALTLALPTMPSTERVGVFVDVANLIYSSRSMRVSIDFGRLLDFLRGNRRLARAQAYAPTNPEPGTDQQFLSVVKGMGYRITTKNYKTFASGAKKADLDLDLCMDIVRLVDAKALDTVVLVSGDSDFLPLLDYCADHGVRVEVAAFDDAAAMILRQSCDLFINLSLVDTIRA